MQHLLYVHKLIELSTCDWKEHVCADSEDQVFQVKVTNKEHNRCSTAKGYMLFANQSNHLHLNEDV